jgi:hypothetical protein
MTQLDEFTVFDFLRTVDVSIVSEVLAELPPEPLIAILGAATAGRVNVQKISKIMRGVETRSIIELVARIPTEYILQYLCAMDAPTLVFMCDSIDASVLATVVVHAKHEAVVQLMEQVDLRRIVKLLRSDVDPMDIAELINNAPVPSLVKIMQEVSVEKMLVLLHKVPMAQMIKLIQKVPAREIANLLARADAQVVAEIGGTTSSSLLTGMLSMAHGRAAGKMLNMAPKTISTVLPAMRPVTFVSNSADERDSGKVRKTQGWRKLLTVGVESWLSSSSSSDEDELSKPERVRTVPDFVAALDADEWDISYDLPTAFSEPRMKTCA